MLRSPYCCRVIGLVAVCLTTRLGVAEVSFNYDIRPILSDKCFQCHGPDANARQNDLRFDIRESATADLGGYAAIIPGQPQASALIQRITATDSGERMPPAEIHKELTPREIDLLRRWIEEGAIYEGHWAFQRIEKPSVPSDPSGWAHNEIDAFINDRLKRNGLKPSPPADKYRLLRRLCLDLTGLPPTPELIQQHVQDDQPLDVARIVQELMNSPAYGEHMAWSWLDAGRYGDSDGYESDPLRNMWPWRDWVIDAFNRKMPYDQFIIEQLAGDLLPNATLSQKLATGFNRNHRLNNEGGILPEEWIVEYVCDRAETTATVFMGLTWGCARCHDHKFDPWTQKNYYEMFAFFNNIPEKGSAPGTSAPPAMPVPSLDHLEEYEQLLPQWENLKAQIDDISAGEEFKAAHEAWLKEIEADPEQLKSLPGNLSKTEFAKWDDKLKASAREHFLKKVHIPTNLREEFLPVDSRMTELRRTGSTVMIMDELPEPKPAFVLERGAYDQPRDAVTAATPEFLPPMEQGLEKNRLGLAKWLTSREHPLTARVAVNRVWEHFFGTGLVKTQFDFGSQGEAPSHPELLDDLAVRLIESGWDLQSLQLLIVTSATYQQSSAVSPEVLAIDPANRLLARGPRYRLPAPVIRDQALAASGSLIERLGGPPVKPYQPAGLWEEIIKGRVKYEPDTGEKLYRRSLYTLWRRAVKPPAMEILDANLRDTCSVTLRRTNTPLQALLLLNDVTFVEAARNLASRVLTESGETPSERIEFAMLLTANRPITDQERELLISEYKSQLAHYTAHPELAKELISIGESLPQASLDSVELAAWTAIARILLNLDETLSKS